MLFLSAEKVRNNYSALGSWAMYFVIIINDDFREFVIYISIIKDEYLHSFSATFPPTSVVALALCLRCFTTELEVVSLNCYLHE